MKTLLLILFPVVLYAQQGSGTSKFYYMASSVLYGITSGVSEGYRSEYQSGGNVSASKEELNAKWHNWKLASAPFIVGTGYSVALHSDLNIPKTIKGLYSSAVLAWISHDVAYNITRKHDPFAKTQAATLPPVDLSIKLAALGSVVLLELLID